MAIAKRSAAIAKRSAALVKWSAALVIFLCMFKVDFISDNTANDPVQWALLIASGVELKNSFAIENDIAQTFDLLKAGGLKEENIVVFSYDNVEYHEDNPYRGKLSLGSGGKNFYAGLRKDYTGDDVTNYNILSVLEGNRRAVGYRKVISSSSRDTIFVVISAHGTPENIVLNLDMELEKRELMKAILSLQSKRKFGSLLMYASSCHGSCVIKDTIFPEHSKIYVITSSKCWESAVMSSSIKFYTPKGKLVTVSTSSDFFKTWITHSRLSNRKEVEVGEQYEEISKALAKPVKGYIIDGDGVKVPVFSTPGDFGDMSVKMDKLEKFQGFDPEWAFNN